MGSVRTGSNAGGKCIRFTLEQEMRPQSGSHWIPLGPHYRSILTGQEQKYHLPSEEYLVKILKKEA